MPFWVYECCGKPLHVGDSVELQLTLFGDVTASHEAEQVTVLEDGLVRVVAHVVGHLTEADGFMRPGTLLQAGPLRFGVVEAVTSSGVCCAGRMYEERHGSPAGRTSGRLSSIARRQVIWERTGERSYSAASYGAAVEIETTEEPMDPTPIESREEPIDGEPDSWDFQLTLSIES